MTNSDVENSEPALHLASCAGNMGDNADHCGMRHEVMSYLTFMI